MPTVGRPLEGLRVLDLGTRISAPFCAALLGEQGAEVIKVEQPGAGDFMRGMGPFARPPEDGEHDDGERYSLSWAVEGRGRRSTIVGDDTTVVHHNRARQQFRDHVQIVCGNQHCLRQFAQQID